MKLRYVTVAMCSEVEQRTNFESIICGNPSRIFKHLRAGESGICDPSRPHVRRKAGRRSLMLVSIMDDEIRSSPPSSSPPSRPSSYCVCRCR